MLKSKRFIAFIVAVTLFVVMIFLTSYNPMELAGAISIITGIYIAGQTYRKSSPPQE